MEFKEQYKHPNWQKKRLEILERDNYTCVECGETEKTLHVHHDYYARSKKIWEYDDEFLQTLCEDCHSERHEYKSLVKECIDVIFRNNHMLNTLHNILLELYGCNINDLKKLLKHLESKK